MTKLGVFVLLLTCSIAAVFDIWVVPVIIRNIQCPYNWVLAILLIAVGVFFIALQIILSIADIK